MLVFNTGLYYYRARHYDPKVGRFLQGDPLPPVPEEMNMYVYARNNPLRFYDPYGRAATDKEPGYKYGDACMGSIRRAKGKKPDDFDIFDICFTSCLELVEMNPCSFAFPDSTLITCVCTETCTAGLKGR